MVSTGIDLALLEESCYTFHCSRDHVCVEELVLFKLRRLLSTRSLNIALTPGAGRSGVAPEISGGRQGRFSPTFVGYYRTSRLVASSSSAFAPSLLPSLKNKAFNK